MTIYEMRLLRPDGEPMIFVTVKADKDAAGAHARKLLEENQEFERAEIWSGMDLIGVAAAER